MKAPRDGRPSSYADLAFTPAHEIAEAVRRVLTEPGLAASMAAEADRIAPDLLWPAVADRYRQLAFAISRSNAALASA